MPEEEQRRSRTVINTPDSRREVERTEVSRTPDKSDGSSTGIIAAIAIGVIALAAIMYFVFANKQDANNTNQNVAQTTPAPTAPPPTIVQQPASQPPIIVQQPAPQQSTPIVINPPSSTAPAQSSQSSAPKVPSAATDDASVQSAISKKIADASELSNSNITATVTNGRVTLNGTVTSNDLKNRAERLIRTIKGVRDVDNQITVTGRE